MRRASLNHAYRLVWNHARNTWVAVAETTRARGKSGGGRAASMAVLAALGALGSPIAEACIPVGSSATLFGSTSCIDWSGSSQLKITNTGSLVGGSPALTINSHTTVGGLDNAGQITSPSIAVSGANNAVQYIDNSVGGTIAGTSGGAGFNFSGMTVSGDFINAGLIDGSVAILLSTSTIGGNLTNSGTIGGTVTSVSILDGSTLVGALQNGATGVIQHGILVGTSSSIAGGISNAGTISAATGDTIAIMSNSRVNGLTNSGLISASSGAAIEVFGSTLGSGLANTGTIAGSSGNAAINLENVSTLAGGITNSGLLTGGVKVATSTTLVGGLANSGTISALTGSARGIEITNNSVLNGGITNSGLIDAGSTGIHVESSILAGALVNTGTIAGGSHGIGLVDASVGNISNSGLVGDIFLATSTLNGNLINSGTIQVSSRSGIEIAGSNITGNIINDGTISGANAIEITGGTVGGQLQNTGLIEGTQAGVVLDANSTLSGGLVNSGTISGSTYAISAAPGADLGGITIAGNDTARFVNGVNAPDAMVTVASGATFTLHGGNDGRFIVDTFANAGTLNLSSQPSGTASGTITGNFNNAGTLNVRVDDTTHYGQLQVSGTATLGGVLTIDVANSAASLPGTLNSIVHAGAISGTFASYSDNSVLFNLTPAYTATDVNLAIAAAPTPPPAPTPTPTPTPTPVPTPTPTPPPAASLVEQIVVDHDNTVAQPAAHVLGQVFANDPTGALSQQFLGFTTNDQVNQAVSETLPLLSGASQAAARSAIGDINRVIEARLRSTNGLSSGDSYADKNVWLKPFGSWTDQENRNGTDGFDANIAGVAFGLDGEVVSGTRLGLSFAYARADVDSNSTWTNSADIDVYQLTGYGSYQLADDIQVDFHVGGGMNRNDGHRALPSFGVVAKSDYDSTTAIAGAGISRTYQLDTRLHFTPSVRADYTWIKDDDYTEKGAGALDLDVNGRTADELIVALDGLWNYELQPGTFVDFNLGVGYDMLSDRYVITSAYAGAPGAAFRTEGIDPSPVLLRGGLGLTHNVSDNTEVTLRYDVEHRTDFLNQTASLKVRWTF